MFAQTCLLFATEASTLSMGLIGIGCVAVYELVRRRPWVKPVAQEMVAVELVNDTNTTAEREHRLAA